MKKINLKGEVKQKIFAKSDYQTTMEMARDLVSWKRKKRMEGFEIIKAEDQDQVLLIATK